MKLGIKIASRRKELGMTQQELADKLFVSVKTISKWETNRGNPEINLIPKIANILDISINELFSGLEEDDEEGGMRSKNDQYVGLINLGFGLLGLLFLFVNYIGNISGYQLMFNAIVKNVFGSIFILCIWIIFFSYLVHIVFGINELKLQNKDLLKYAAKVLKITFIISISALGYILLFCIFDRVIISAGLILTCIIFIALLAYKIYLNKEMFN